MSGFNDEGLSPEEEALLEEGGQDEAEELSLQEEEGDQGEGGTQAPPQEEEGQEEGAQGEETNSANPASDPNRPEGYVPHAALHQERTAHHETRRQLDEMQSKVAMIAERLSQHQANPPQPQPAPQQQEVPDADSDPIGFMQYQQRRIEELEAYNLQQQQAQQEYQQQQQAQQREQEQQQALFNDITREYNSYAEIDPSVNDAYNSLMEHVAKTGQVHGLSGNQLQEYVVTQTRQFATYARQNGMQIGPYVKQLAGTIGWVENKQGSQQQSDLGDKIDQINETKKVNKSMNGTGGNSGKTTLDDLANMSGPELERFMSKHPDVADALMGT